MMSQDEVDKLVMRIDRAWKRMSRAYKNDMPLKFREKAANLYVKLVDRMLEYKRAKKAKGVGENGK